MKTSPTTLLPIELTAEGIQLIDQNQLPTTFTTLTLYTVEDVVEAIASMKVRGAPAIGIAGAFGVVQSARHWIRLYQAKPEVFIRCVMTDAETLRIARPTAVNLTWAIDEMMAVFSKHPEASPTQLLTLLTEEALHIQAEDLANNRKMGQFGAELIQKQFPNQTIHILTHCNAGALATAGYGTALGVLRALHEAGVPVHVYADETRPRQQGAKLTTWELQQDGIPVTLITDGMSGLLMRQGKVDVAIVGADRIAQNGDTANKIGTYNVALIAKAHEVPFYVAAPWSTFDTQIATGEDIPIEERDPEEIHTIGNTRICAEGITFFNPGFDVTPAHLITGFITERGILQPPFRA